jgi:hypothetical protein
MRTCIHPVTLKTFVIGSRKRPDQDKLKRSLHMDQFMAAAPPDPPARTYYSRAAKASLSDVMGNDVEGCCTISACGHLEGVFTANSGKPIFIPTLEEINTMYSRCEGPPGFPAADNGCDEITVLDDYKTNGLAGHKCVNWMRVDATNVRQCQIAIWLFENLYLTLELPDAYVNPFPSSDGFVWNVAGDPDPNNGHAIVSTDYNFTVPQYPKFEIDTWGMQGWMTPGATMKYCTPQAGGGCYTALSYEIINRAKQRAPNGMNWAELSAYAAGF